MSIVLVPDIGLQIADAVYYVKFVKRHHTSICDRLGKQLMTATSAGKTAVIHSVVVVIVQGVRCRALLDTGAGSSYASAALLSLL